MPVWMRLLLLVVAGCGGAAGTTPMPVLCDAAVITGSPEMFTHSFVRVLECRVPEATAAVADGSPRGATWPGGCEGRC